MTRDQAQQLYDYCGSAYAVGQLVGLEKDMAWKELKNLGVTFRKPGGNRYKRKEQKAIRRECHKTFLPSPRLCVVHDQPNACDLCRNRYQAVGDIAGQGTASYAVSGAWR